MLKFIFEYYPGKMKIIVFLFLGFFYCYATQYTDYVQCVEQRQCGLFSVCGFTLTPPVSNPNVPSARQYGLLKGYIMRVTNGLTSSIQLTWDILASSNCSTANITRTFTLSEHNSRYFNTHCNGLHTIRLQVGNDTADTEIANPEFTCSVDQACEYLMRACFANSDDPSCMDYTYYCEAVLKYSNYAIDTFRQQCIPECLADFYSTMITNPYQFKSDEIVEMISKYYSLKVSNTPTLAASTTLEPWAILLIIIGAIVFISGCIGLFFYLRKKTNLFRRTGRV